MPAFKLPCGYKYIAAVQCFPDGLLPNFIRNVPAGLKALPPLGFAASPAVQQQSAKEWVDW
jgi:hypothetical protein